MRHLQLTGSEGNIACFCISTDQNVVHKEALWLPVSLLDLDTRLCTPAPTSRKAKWGYRRRVSTLYQRVDTYENCLIRTLIIPTITLGITSWCCATTPLDASINFAVGFRRQMFESAQTTTNHLPFTFATRPCSVSGTMSNIASRMKFRCWFKVRMRPVWRPTAQDKCLETLGQCSG